MNELTSREKEILELRDEYHYSLYEISRLLSKPITRERVRQIYNVAKKKKEALMKRNVADIVTKAGNLAEFETKIGISLDIFIRIFTDGIYSKEFGPLRPDDFHVVCNLRSTEPYIEHIHDLWYHNKFLLRDYGKTWRLLSEIFPKDKDLLPSLSSISLR